MKRITVVIALLMFAACTSGKSTSQPSTSTAPQYTPVFVKGPCKSDVPVDARVECGTLTVPEDRSKPTGRQVVMPVAIVHTADPNPAADPVVYLEGGPGFPALARVGQFLRKGQAGNRDVILLDQRGTGDSNPKLDCPEIKEATATIFGAADSFDAESKVLRDAFRVCLDRIRATGVDLHQYNTTEVAHDVADLRVAMGINEWNLFGVSYGTTVALVTMRDHPRGIRSAVLDSVIPTDDPANADEAIAGFERATDVLFEGCAKDARCHAAFPSLEADVGEAVRSLDANPYHGTIQNTALNRQTPIAITGSDAQAGLYVALYETDLIPQLPFVISQLKSSAAGAIIDELARQGISFASTAATAQAAAVLCYDRGAFLHDDDGKRILKEHPNDGTILLLTALTCSDVDVAAAPPGFNDPVRSDIPTLVLAGEYDPVTPPDQSRHASESLSHSTFVLFPGMGHSEVFASPECPEIIFRAFLADPLANVDTSCIASMGPPNWNVG